MKSSKQARQYRSDQVGLTSIKSGTLYKSKGVQQNPQFGNPGKRSLNDPPKSK